MTLRTGYFPSDPDLKDDAALVDDPRQPPRDLADGDDRPQIRPGTTPLRDILDTMDSRFFYGFLFIFCSMIFMVAVSLTDNSSADPSLQKVFLIFRHGTRAPGFTYKNDPYNRNNEEFWPNGPGELTATGKLEAYELGERLRERYHRFLGDHYKVKEFRAYTTLIERTMMSAQLVLASLFPPKSYQEWNGQMKWQPVPVYPEEIVNATSGCSCPRFALEFKNNVKKHVPADFGFETDVGQILKENSGEPEAVPISLFTRVWDTVYFQDRARLPIPDWLKPIYPEKMSVLAVKYLKFYLAASKTQELLVQDPFGRAITTFFTESPRKMELHSLHDIHIMSLFMLLDIEYNSFPEPGSAIAIELHERKDGQYFEVHFYRTPKDKVPVQMKMPCGMTCPISDLIKRCRTFKVENYDELCNDGDGAVPTHITEFKLHF